MNKSSFKWLGIFLFLLGVFFLVNSKINFTGSVIGFSGISLTFSFVLGIVLMIGGISLLINIEALEKLASNIATYPKLKEDLFKEELNKKVESGEWIELKIERARDTTNPEKYAQATAIYKYWGPKDYKGLSTSQLYKLYRQGEVGKTHEMIRGSKVYKEDGRLSKGTISIPPEGSRVLHRHWEVKEMSKYRNKNKRRDS